MGCTVHMRHERAFTDQITGHHEFIPGRPNLPTFPGLRNGMATCLCICSYLACKGRSRAPPPASSRLRDSNNTRARASSFHLDCRQPSADDDMGTADSNPTHSAGATNAGAGDAAISITSQAPQEVPITLDEAKHFARHDFGG